MGGIVVRIIFRLENFQKSLYNLGVELCPGVPLQFPKRVPITRRTTVNAVRGHGVKSVQDRYNPGTDRYLIAYQSTGITLSVIPLLMMVYQRHHRLKGLY